MCDKGISVLKKTDVAQNASKYVHLTSIILKQPHNPYTKI